MEPLWPSTQLISTQATLTCREAPLLMNSSAPIGSIEFLAPNPEWNSFVWTPPTPPEPHQPLINCQVAPVRIIVRQVLAGRPARLAEHRDEPACEHDDQFAPKPRQPACDFRVTAT